MTYYYLYEIKNKINGKIYVGVHKTDDLNDGYMGSGKVIRHAIAKYGIENFDKEILEYFPTSEEMYRREKEVVTEEFLARADVYNLRRGGHGGFEFITSNGLSAWTQRPFDNPFYQNSELSTLGNKLLAELRLDPEYNEWFLSTRRHGLTEDIRDRAVLASLTETARKKQKDRLAEIGHARGEKNSQFGTCWIWHELIGNKKCKKELLPLYIEQGWIKGRFTPVV